jgi:NADPH:quinone reductase-like Zn-dependent oxidoreductase
VANGVRIHESGGSEVLRIEEIEVEEPGDGEVRIRVRAIGINRTEITLRSGRSPAKPPLPAKIGFEAAGEIEAIGAGVKGFAIGDRVALVPAYAASRYGLYCESSLAPVRSLIKIPNP